MKFYLVTMRHPDGGGWDEQLAPHVRYLRMLVERGVLKASGPLKGQGRRTGFLVFHAEDEAAVRALVDDDPFVTAGLIEELSIAEWDPLFGQFAAEATGLLAGKPLTAIT